MGKENTSKEWKCILPMFLTSFSVYFVFGYAYFMSRLDGLKLLSGFSGTMSGFFGEDRLATLSFSPSLSHFAFYG